MLPQSRSLVSSGHLVMTYKTKEPRAPWNLGPARMLVALAHGAQDTSR